MGHDLAPFDHEYSPGRFVYGPGRIADLGAVCADLGVDRPLVVTGRNVGADPGVMNPVCEGLGERAGRVFAETTPAKEVTTIEAGVDRMADEDVDGLVAVGGGSSIDVATVMAALAAAGPPLEDLFVTRTAEGRLVSPDRPTETVPLVAVPTTLAGADLTCGAGLYLETGDLGTPDGDVSGGAIYGHDLAPSAVCYDPELLASTPAAVLATSAMNGFDHGIEVLYSRNATPITDATAARGLGFLREALPALDADPGAVDVLGAAQVGTALTTYGLAPDPESSKIGPIHAVGHAIARNYDVQQGAVHAVVAPEVLRTVFDAVDGRRADLARALGVSPASTDPTTDAESQDAPGADGPVATAVVDAVEAVRDGLGLPTRLRSIPDLQPDHLDALATAVVRDDGATRGPPGFEPSVAVVRGILERSW